MASNRLQKELEDIQRDPLPGIFAEPIDDDIFHWQGMITGPADSPYEGGVFFLDIHFSQHHPWNPPEIIFTTPIYHPNISNDSKICLEGPERHWPASFTISKILIHITALLSDPDPDDPLVLEVAEIYKTDRELYNKLAKEWTEMHAM